MASRSADARPIAFVGAAGVGKTYSLIAAVKKHLNCTPLQEPYQSVLGLTFMHGARRLLHDRLAKALGRRRLVECSTIDSFALALVRRFRRHAGLVGVVDVDPDGTDDWIEKDGTHRASFDVIRRTALRLLCLQEVRGAIASAYPVTVVDEFQDCSDELLEIIQTIAGISSSFIAADGFQSLEVQPSAAA